MQYIIIIFREAVKVDETILLQPILGILDAIPHAELENFAKAKIADLQSHYTSKHNKIRTYFQELNLETTIPPPSLEWESDVIASSFFAKIVFAHSYIKALLSQTFNANYAVITAPNNDPRLIALASFFRKLFGYIVENSNLLSALDQTIFYALLSGKLALYIDTVYEMNWLGEFNHTVKIKPIHPLYLMYTQDYTTIAINHYLPYDDYKLLKQSFLFKIDDSLLSLRQDTDRETPAPPEKDKIFVKLTELYTRYVNKQASKVFLLKLIVVEDKYLTHVAPVETFDKSLPFVITNFYADDVETSLADLIYPYYKEESEVLRKIIDRMKLATAYALLVNTENIELQDNKDLVIRPYTIFYQKGDLDAVKPIQLATFDPQIFTVKNQLQFEIQNISGLTEFLMGLPSGRSRITAKEVEIKTAQTQQFFNTIITRLEENFIRPVIIKTMLAYIKLFAKNRNALQHLNLEPYELKAFQMTLNNDLAQNKPEGYNLAKALTETIIVKANGITSRLNAEKKMADIMEFLHLAASTGLIQFINVPQLLPNILEYYGLPPTLIKSPSHETEN